MEDNSKVQQVQQVLSLTNLETAKNQNRSKKLEIRKICFKILLFLDTWNIEILRFQSGSHLKIWANPVQSLNVSCWQWVGADQWPGSLLSDKCRVKFWVKIQLPMSSGLLPIGKVKQQIPLEPFQLLMNWRWYEIIFSYLVEQLKNEIKLARRTVGRGLRLTNVDLWKGGKFSDGASNLLIFWHLPPSLVVLFQKISQKLFSEVLSP